MWETKSLDLHTLKAAPNHKAVHLSTSLFEMWLQKAFRE